MAIKIVHVPIEKGDFPIRYVSHYQRVESATKQPSLVGLEHVLFSHVLEIIIPIGFHIFQRGGSTTNQDHYPQIIHILTIN